MCIIQIKRIVIRLLSGLFLMASIVSLAGCGNISTICKVSDLELAFNVPEASPAGISVSESPVFSEEAVFESIPGKTGHHAATITVFSDGELMAGWYSYDGEHELAGSAIYLAKKPAGSNAWETPQLHIDRPKGDGNPVLYSEGDRVWLFQAVVPFGWATSHIEVQESFDRGLTWTSPAVLSEGIGGNTKYPPIRLADGTLLLPAYNELLQRSIFYASTDGTQWELRSAAVSDPGNLQPSIVQLENGRLLSVMRNEKKGRLWMMASDDGAKTWLEPSDSGFPNPGSATEMIQLQNGHLMLIFNDSSSARRPLSVAISSDDGKTWPYKRIIADGDQTYSYPSAIQGPDGLIHILYSYNREKIMHVTINEAWVVESNP